MKDSVGVLLAVMLHFVELAGAGVEVVNEDERFFEAGVLEGGATLNAHDRVPVGEEALLELP